MNRYDILQSISQRKDGTLSAENAELALIANELSRAARESREDERESENSSFNVIQLNEAEQRQAETWAKANGHWIPMANVFDLGRPGPSGSESDTYLSLDGYVYKQNNLLHSNGSIVEALIKFILHNIIYPDTSYSFVGFTGFNGRSIYPIVRQNFVENSRPATQNEIDCYMAALGFEKLGVGTFCNKQFYVSDLLPKNALRDDSGDIFIIDAEIRLKE